MTDTEHRIYSLDDLVQGKKLYQKRARRALPLLVRQARSQEKITYSDLAAELKMPNPRNLNHVLGLIGQALLDMGKEWQCSVPPIHCIVIGKNTGRPGDGFYWFTEYREAFEKADEEQRERLTRRMTQEVFSYRRWEKVLARAGLQAVPGVALQLPTTPLVDRKGHKYGTGGESAAHKRLKEYVANHPKVVGLKARLAPGETEYEFPSADVIDVLFTDGEKWIGVEVKSAKSDHQDLTRGLFQCVKYRALIEACQKTEQQELDARVVLLLEGSFPQDLLALQHVLGIEVVDQISPK